MPTAQGAGCHEGFLTFTHSAGLHSPPHLAHPPPPFTSQHLQTLLVPRGPPEASLGAATLPCSHGLGPSPTRQPRLDSGSLTSPGTDASAHPNVPHHQLQLPQASLPFPPLFKPIPICMERGETQSPSHRRSPCQLSARELRTCDHTAPSPPRATAALLTTAKRCKRPRCPNTDEQINTMWSIHTMECDSAMKQERIPDTCYHVDEP